MRRKGSKSGPIKMNVDGFYDLGQTVPFVVGRSFVRRLSRCVPRVNAGGTAGQRDKGGTRLAMITIVGEGIVVFDRGEVIG